MKKLVLMLLVAAVVGVVGCFDSESDDSDTNDTEYDDSDETSESDDFFQSEDSDYDYEIGSVAYYVDADAGSDDNDGSESAPFATITYALEQAQGGEMIYVADGDYGDLRFGADFYSESSNYATPIEEVFTDWVTLRAMDGEAPELGYVQLGTLYNEDASDAIDFDQLGNSDLRLRIDGFTITNDMDIYGSRYVDIRNCTISQQGDFASMTDAEKLDYMSDAGIAVQNGRYVLLLDNEITNTGYGVWGMTTDFTIKGNHIHHVTHDGLQIHGGENWLVEGNIIHDLDDGTPDSEKLSYNNHIDGMHFYMAGSSSKYAHRMDNFVIRGNLIYHAESMDVMMNSTDIEGGGYGDFIWENNIFGPSGGYMIIWAAVFEDGNVFRHNTVLYTPNDQWTSQWGRTFGSEFGSPDSGNYYIQTKWSSEADHPVYPFYNNILVKTSLTVPWPSDGTDIAGHSNLYYSGDTDATLDDGAGWVVSALPYETIDSSVQDIIDVGDFPGFPLSDSPAIDNGYIPTDIDSYDKDFSGYERDELPDIGALEYD
jgi:hypothetical protein